MATLAELMAQVAPPQAPAGRTSGAFSPEYQAYIDQLRQQRLAREVEHERTRGRTLGEVVSDAGIQFFGKGTVGLGQGLYGVGNLASAGALDRVTGMSENFQRTYEILDAQLSDPTQRDKAEVQAAFDEGFLPGMGRLVTSLPAMQDLALSTAPQVLPAAAMASRAAGVARAAGASADEVAGIAGRVASRTGGAQAGGTTDIEAINAIREAGGSETEQQLGGLGAGLGVAAVNPLITKAVGAEKLYGGIAARLAGAPTTRTGGVLRNTAVGGVRETAEETLQSGGEQLAQNLVTPGVSALENVPQAMGMGGVAGGILGTGLGAFQGSNIRSNNVVTRAANDGLDEVSKELGVDVREEAPTPTRTPVRDAMLARVLAGEQPGTEGFEPMSAEEVVQQRRQDEQAAKQVEIASVMQEVFTIQEDPQTGEPRFMVYNNDLQRLEEVDQETAMRTAEVILEQRQPSQLLQAREADASEAALVEQEMALRENQIDLSDTPLPQEDALPLPDVEVIGETRPTIESIAETVERVTGQRRGTSLSKKDLVQAEDIVRESLFRQDVDPVSGDVTYTEYSPDLQRMVEVTPQEVDAAVKAHIRQLQQKPAKSWKEFAVKNFGMKPNQLTGKVWKQFADAADTAGVKPEDPGADAFLQEQARALASDPNTRSTFAAELGSRYGAQEDVTLDELLNLSDDEIIARLNTKPGESGNTDDVALSSQDVADFVEGEVTPVVQVTDAQGNDVQIVEDADGKLFARDGEQYLGYVEQSAEETQLFVATDARGRGLGTALAKEAIRRNPNAPAGSFSPAGEAAYRAAIGELKGERAASEVEAAEVIADDPPPALESVPPPAGETPIEVIRAERAIAKEVQRSGRSAPLARPNAIRRLFNAAKTASDLDESFNAIKQTRAWQALDTNVQDQLTEQFSSLYDEMEAAGRFSRVDSKPETTVSAAEFRAMVANAQANKPANGADIVGFDTVEEYRRSTGNAAPDDAAGAYYQGKAYVIRENTPDAGALAANIMHEHGHRGLEGLLGDRLTAVTNRMWANAKLRERIKTKRDRYNLDRSTAAEEVLVDMIVGDEKLAKSTFAKVRSAIDAGALRLLGVRNLSVSDNDVDRILRNTAAWLRDLPLDEPSVAQDDKMMGRLDTLLGDPRRIESAPRYSRMLNALDAELTAAAGSTTRSHAMNDYAEGSVKYTKHVINETGGKIVRTLLKATPLSQMVNLYSPLWDDTGDTNQLASLSNEVRNKEASFNQATTRKKQVKYRDGTSFEVSPRELADEWYKLSRSNETQGKLIDTVQQFGTLYHVWPDANWQDQHQKLDYQRLGFTEDERKAAHAKIRNAWKQMTPEAQAVYKKSQALYQFMTETQYQELANEMARSSNLEQGTQAFTDRLNKQIRNEIQALKTGPYSPLRRFGDHVVTVRDEKGDVVDFRGFDREDEAEAYRADVHSRLVSENKNDWSVSRDKKEAFQSNVDGVNHAEIQRLEGQAERAISGLKLADADADHIKNNLRAALSEIYLKAQPEHSLLSHANRRKGIEGFTMDSMRAFSDYAIKTARRTASLRHDGNASRALLAMDQTIRAEGRKPVSDPTTKDLAKMRDVLNAVRDQRVSSLRSESSPVADKLSAGSFVWFMTSPSQLFVNAMQTPMVAFPRLAANYRGFGASSFKALTEGMGLFARSGGDLLKEGAPIAVGARQVLQGLHEDGTLDFTLAHDIASVAQGDFSSMSPHWRAATNMMAFSIHKSEVFNRQVTAYAALKLEARKRGIDLARPLRDADVKALADTATKYVLDTHFTYSRSDKAQIMQGPWRRVLLQFQHYRLNMLAMISKDIRDSFTGTPEEKATARRALSWIIGGQAAFAGAAGTVLSPIAFFIMDMFRDEDDLLSSQTEFSRAVPQWLAHGVLAGVIDTTRVSGGQLLPFFGDRAYAPTEGSAKDKFSYYLSQNIGPWAGLLTDVATGVEKTIEGDYMAAAQNLTPKPFKDALKAIDSHDGVKDSRDIVYMDPGFWDTFTQAVGLKSGRRREAEEVRSGAYQASIRRSELRRRALGKLALGTTLDDGTLQQEGFEAVNRWNEANPDDPISGQSITAAIRQRVLDQASADATGLTVSNLPPSVLRDLGL